MTLLRRLIGLCLSQQGILVLFLILEVGVFSRIGHNFATVENGFEILRLSVEIGLLAVAMTPVVVTGGIDLSVGSLLGLCAVLFGKMWRDGGLPLPISALCTCGIGVGAGLLNGLLVTRFRIPPLIVTLGTFSLFRGLAEAITNGVDNFGDFPESLLFLGNGYLLRTIPAQLPLFFLITGFFWILLHRTVIGRSWVAIGFSAEGARYSGIPVDRRLRLAYLLAGLVSAIAALLYVARFGQAKADAGLNYELLAITAVVLGGTSIFGGSGSIPGTLLGLLIIAILKNGLRLSDYPTELSGILSGVLFIAALGMHQFQNSRAFRRKTILPTPRPHPSGTTS